MKTRVRVPGFLLNRRNCDEAVESLLGLYHIFIIIGRCGECSLNWRWLRDAMMQHMRVGTPDCLREVEAALVFNRRAGAQGAADQKHWKNEGNGEGAIHKRLC
jgi:hypothetical protein